MNANVIEFYRKVRTDQGLIEALSEGKSVEEISEIAVTKAAEMNMPLRTDDVLAVSGNLNDVIAAAVNDDELTEFELELVAAGVPMTSIGGEV